MRDLKEEEESRLEDEEDIELLLEEANAFGLRWEVDNTAKAVKNIKKKGVKILSYFIQSKTTVFKEKELNENFQIMYGKEASFIDPKNIYQITKTLNNLFLKRDLIS